MSQSVGEGISLNGDNRVTSSTDSEKDKRNVSMDIESQMEGNKSEDMEEDDVPDDFFDDFSNKDFLAGLDVVDAWEDGFMPSNVEANPSNKHPRIIYQNTTDQKKTPTKDHYKNKPGDVENRYNNRTKTERYKGRYERNERRSRSRGRGSKRRSNSLQKSQEGAVDELRRDPNKTKRDIQRDKLKCARDKEAKMISEKLRVVETGLVPPGMEMDVDLNDLRRKEEKHRKTSPSPERSRRIKRRQSRSPSPPARRKFRSPNVTRYPASPKRHYSPVPYRRTHTYKRQSRSPVHRERSFEHRMHQERRSYEKRKRSPGSTDRLRMGDREPSRHSREERSTSRKRAISFLEELDHKLSISAAHQHLHSIQQKLNGGPGVNAILNKYAPQPVPVPVPGTRPIHVGIPNVMNPPAQYHQTPVYDQQFFIGSNDAHFSPVPAVQPQNFMHPPMHLPPIYNKPPQFYEQPPVFVAQPSEVPKKPDVESLFRDDNITLSNFLAITERVSDVSKTIDIKDKVKVITRCQDAIKIMTENTKPSGRFFYHGNQKVAEKVPDTKGVSPMKRMVPVRFHFTTKVKPLDEKYYTPMNRLLLKLGLKDPPPLTASSKDTITVPSDFLPPGRDDPLRTNALMKTTQTDPFKCDDCEARKKIEYVNVGVQCEIADTANFGCQVVEDDFLNTARSALKSILKNQSLASLTPAQILAQLGHKPEEKKEIFPAARKLSQDSPEKNQRDDFYAGRSSSTESFDRNRSESWGASYDRNPDPVSPGGPGSRFQRATYNAPSQNFSATNFGGTTNYRGQAPNNNFGVNNFRNQPRQPLMRNPNNPFNGPQNHPTGRFF